MWEGCKGIDTLKRWREKKQVNAGNRPTSYAPKPCADGVRQNAFHRRRCLFWNDWFVVIRIQSVGQDTTDMRKVSTRFISVPRRHRSNTSRWYFGSLSCLFVCPSHLVRTHSIHHVFPLGVCHSAELFADRAPPHSFEGFVNNWICSINSRTCSSSTSVVVEQFLLLEFFDASRQVFLCHVVFQVRFLENTLHLQPRREPLEFPVGLLILHLVHPSAKSWIQLQDLLIRLGSMLAESRIIRSHWCRLLHVVFPYGPNQVSPRVALGYWNIQLSGHVRKLTPVHFCETRERLFLSTFSW